MEQAMRLSEVRQFIGFLSVEIDELHSVEVPRLAEALDKFLALPARAAASPFPQPEEAIMPEPVTIPEYRQPDSYNPPQGWALNSRGQSVRVAASPAPGPPRDLVWQVLTRLTSHGLSSPEALIEADGDLCFDWCDNGGQLSVSIRQDGRIGWAALIGAHKSHGHFYWPTWNQELTTAFDLLAAGVPKEPK